MNRGGCGMEEGVTRERPCPSHASVLFSSTSHCPDGFSRVDESLLHLPSSLL